MSENVLLGDIHIREEEPFSSSFVNFMEWVREQPWNIPENTLFLLGDIFCQEFPTPTEYMMALVFFLDVIKCKKIYTIRGNHDVKRNINALDFLRALEHSGREVIYKPRIVESLGVNFLCLPHYDTNVYDDYQDMKKDYEKNKLSQIPREEIDSCNFVLGHFSVSKMFGGEIDMSWLPIRKILGHVHNQSMGEEYIGSALITRFDEKDKLCRGFIIGSNKKIKEFPIPMFLNYYQIEYGKDISSIPNKPKAYLIDVMKAPSKEAAKEFYKNEFIHKVYTITGKTVTIVDKENLHDKKSVEQYAIEFLEINNVEEDLAERIKVLIKS